MDTTNEPIENDDSILVADDIFDESVIVADDDDEWGFDPELAHDEDEEQEDSE